MTFVVLGQYLPPVHLLDIDHNLFRLDVELRTRIGDQHLADSPGARDVQLPDCFFVGVSGHVRTPVLRPRAPRPERVAPDPPVSPPPYRPPRARALPIHARARAMHPSP